jgi:hypothetical protein
MRIQALLVLTTGLFLTGCGPGEPAKPAPATPPAPEKKADSTSGGNPITAPVDYLATAAKAKHSADASLDTVALKDLSTQVQLFFGQEGRYPKDLSELITMKYMKVLPPVPAGSQLEYDASNGQVKVVKLPKK